MDLAEVLPELPVLAPGVDVEGKPFGPRALSYILDIVAINATGLAVSYVGGSAFGFALYFIAAAFRYEPEISLPSSTLLDLFLGFIISLVYFAIFESFYGATPAKLVLGMRVATLNGDRPSLFAATVRGLWRLIDGLFFGLVAASSMKAPLRQRYGDKRAKTLVVPSKSPILKNRPHIGYFFLAAFLYLLASLVMQLLVLLAYTSFQPTR